MSLGGQALLCLEPRIDGARDSGGFFYNDCLAAVARGLAGSRSSTQSPVQPLFSIKVWDGRRLPPGIVLLDSLWWYVHKRPLEVLSSALVGRSWGLIMHGLPAKASGLLGDMAKASFVVVPSFWAAGQLEKVRSSLAANGVLDVRILYPGWDGRPGLVPGKGSPSQACGKTSRENPGDRPVRLASSSNWTPAKGLVEAACVLEKLSRNPACPAWLWHAAGTPDPLLIAEAHSCLGPKASSLVPLGHLDSAALIRLLHGTDIFLHPSGQETFCLSVFEAALAGCRVVARAIGGVPEAMHLASLLRSQLGLPPTEVHLAPIGEPMAPGAVHPASGGVEVWTELFGQALEAALTAVLAVPARVPYPEHPASPTLLREFSWQGRLDKLLLGQSDRPLPAITKAEQVEAS